MGVYTGGGFTSKQYDPYNELSNDPFETTARLQTRYAEAGQRPPEAKRSGIGNLLRGALTLIDTPGNLVRGALEGAQRGSKYGGGLSGVLSGGLKGAGSGLAHGVTLGKYGKQYSTADWLDRMQVNNKYVKGVGGFIGDVALDPTTYLSFGTSAVAKGLGKGLVKGAAKKAIAGTQGKIGERLVGALSTNNMFKQLSKTSDIAQLQKGLQLDATSDVLTAGQKYLGTEGVTSMGVADKLGELTGQSTDLMKYTDVSKLAKRRAGSLYRSVLDPSIKDSVKVGAKAEDVTKLAQGTDYLKTAPDITTPTSQAIRQNIRQLFSKREISRLETMSPDTYNAMYNLGEVLGLDKMQISSMGGKAKNTFAKGFRRTSENLVQALGDTKRLSKVRDAGERLMQSSDDAAKNLIEVEYTNALKAVVDETGKRRFVSFAGRPLADITPYTDELVGKIGKGITASAQAGNPLAQLGVGISDLMTRTFSNAVPLSLRNSKFAGAYKQLVDRISNHKLASGLVPKNSINGVLNALGQRAVDFGEQAIEFGGKQVKPNDLYVYWKEGMEHVNLKDKLIKQGASEADIAEQVSENAITKYIEDILPYIDKSPDVYDYFMDLSARTDMMNSVYKSMDTALGKNYTGQSGYIHHAYHDEMIDELDQLIKSGTSTLKGVASKAHTPAQARKFKTIADAEIEGGLKGYNNIIDLMALRQSYTGRLAHRVQLMDGATNLWEATTKGDEFADVLTHQDRLGKRLATESEEGMTRQALPEDLAQAEAQRVVDATRDSLMRGLGQEGLLELKDVIRKTKPRPEDSSRFVEMDLSYGKVPNKKFYIDKNIAYQMQRLDSLFFNDQNFNQIKNVYDSVTRAIKTWQTVLNPAFHIRNNVGEFVMSALDMNPKALKDSYSKAFKLIQSGVDKVNISGTEYTIDNAMNLLSKITDKTKNLTMNGQTMNVKTMYDNLVDKTSIELGGKKYTTKELLDEFEAKGLRGTGLSGETFKESLTQMKQSTLGQDFVSAVARDEAMKGKNVLSKGARYAKSAYLGSARKVSELTDDYHRLAHFIGAIGRGETFEQASNTVKQFHVDYQDLSRFEKNVMRRLAPYYTFSRKNLPMQLRLMLEKPAYPDVIGHMIDNANSALGDPARPEYMENNLSIPVLETGEGNILSLNLGLPLGDLSKFKFDMGEMARETFGQANPMLKVLPELGTGRNIGLDIPIQDNLDYLLGTFGGARDVYKMATSMGQDEETESAYGRPSITGINRLLPISMNNPMQTELSEAYRYRDELLEDMKERKKRGEPIPEVMSPAEEYANALGIPLRDVPKYISREKYEGKRSYREYKKAITPDRR